MKSSKPALPRRRSVAPADVACATPITALEHENARLRGDLRTISRRLSHDLRNPLNCIVTAAEALRDAAAPLDAMTERFAQSIVSSVDEAGAIVQRLSVVIKATADPLTPQVVAMHEIVATTLKRLEPELLEAGRTVAQPPTWPTVRGVPAWIDLIWENLIRNSLQHSGAWSHPAIGWDTVGGQHHFWVRDAGLGVPLERRGRLFHPLDRLHEGNAPAGWGLAIVRRLVELQGGHCGYDAAPAPGGTFYFTLHAA